MEIHEQPNPMLEPENYFKKYQENIDNLKNQPEVVEFDKLCFETFEASEIGKRFLEFAKERFFIYSQISRGDANYQTNLIWQEGFRDAYRMIMHHVKSHQQRIAAGATNDRSK